MTRYSPALVLVLFALLPVSASADDSIDQLKREVERKRGELEPVVGRLLHDRDVVASISASPILSFIEFLAHQADEVRKTRFRSTDVSGQLWKKDIDCGALGDGSQFIEIDNDDDIRLDVLLDRLGGNWSGSRGLTVTGRLNAILRNIGLHWHVDPCIGGGFGGVVEGNCRASANFSANGVFGVAENELLEYRVRINSSDDVEVSCGFWFGSAIGNRTITFRFPVEAAEVARGAFEGVWEEQGTLVVGSPPVLVRAYQLRLHSPILERDDWGIRAGASVDLEWQ